MILVFGGPVGEEPDRLDAEVFVGKKVVLKLGAQFIVADDNRRFEIKVGFEEITEEEPGRNTEFQQKEKGDSGKVLALRACTLVGNQEHQRGESKIINKAAYEGSGHFGVVRFQVAKIFYKYGAYDDVPDIEYDQKIFQAFGVAFVEK